MNPVSRYLLAAAALSFALPASAVDPGISQEAGNLIGTVFGVLVGLIISAWFFNRLRKK